MSAATPGLVLHYHPLSSYCQKVLIAARALGVALDLRLLNLGDPTERAAFLALWPTGKMPLLVDQGRVVPESSIQIEYLQQHHAQPGRTLIPSDREAALQVRLWDRLFDLHVMAPMQALTGDLLRPAAERDARGVTDARSKLATAYAMADQQLQGRTWATGEDFTLADCAAAPALFYAIAYLPLGPEQGHLAAYFERLLNHPAVAATVDDARPFFQYFPGRVGLSRRFFNPEESREA